MQILDVAVDAIDSPVVLHVALAKLKTLTIQTTVYTQRGRNRGGGWWYSKTECSETYLLDKGVCALGDSE